MMGLDSERDGTILKLARPAYLKTALINATAKRYLTGMARHPTPRAIRQVLEALEVPETYLPRDPDPKPKPRIGRPPVWTDEHYNKVLKLLEGGELLHDIGLDGSLPQHSTVYDYIERNPEFASRFARTRERQAHAHAARALRAAREATPLDVSVARLIADNERWMAARLSPRDYGDKLEATVTINIGLAERLNAAIGRASRVIDVEPGAIEDGSESG